MGNLPRAEVGMVHFCPQMIIGRFPTSIRQISRMGDAQELLPEVTSGSFFLWFLLKQSESGLEKRICSSDHHLPLSCRPLGAMPKEN